MDNLADLQGLVLQIVLGARVELLILNDYLMDEPGVKMLPLEVGQQYLIETMARWYILGCVEETGPCWVKLNPAIQIYNIPDFDRLVNEGQFGQTAEFTIMSKGIILPIWDIGPCSEWDFDMPKPKA